MIFPWNLHLYKFIIIYKWLSSYLISRGMKSMFSDDSARVGYIWHFLWVRYGGYGTVGTVGTVRWVRWVRYSGYGTVGTVVRYGGYGTVGAGTHPPYPPYRTHRTILPYPPYLPYRTQRTHRTVPSVPTVPYPPYPPYRTPKFPCYSKEFPCYSGEFPCYSKEFPCYSKEIWGYGTVGTVGTVRWVRWVRYGGYAGYGTGGTVGTVRWYGGYGTVGTVGAYLHPPYRTHRTHRTVPPYPPYRTHRTHHTVPTVPTVPYPLYPPYRTTAPNVPHPSPYHHFWGPYPPTEHYSWNLITFKCHLFYLSVITSSAIMSFQVTGLGPWKPYSHPKKKMPISVCNQDGSSMIFASHFKMSNLSICGGCKKSCTSWKRWFIYPIVYRVSTIQDDAGFRNHPQHSLSIPRSGPSNISKVKHIASGKRGWTILYKWMHYQITCNAHQFWWEII